MPVDENVIYLWDHGYNISANEPTRQDITYVTASLIGCGLSKRGQRQSNAGGVVWRRATGTL